MHQLPGTKDAQDRVSFQFCRQYLFCISQLHLFLKKGGLASIMLRLPKWRHSPVLRIQCLNDIAITSEESVLTYSVVRNRSLHPDCSSWVKDTLTKGHFVLLSRDTFMQGCFVLLGRGTLCKGHFVLLGRDI